MGFGDSLDKAIAVVAPGAARSRRENRIRFEMTSGLYKAARPDQMDGSEWLGSVDAVSVSSRDLRILRNKSRDLNRNNPIAAGATDTMTANIGGNGLRPQSRLRADRLGITEERAEELRRQAEAVWAEFEPIADAEGIDHFCDLQLLIIRKVLEDGEIIALPGWANEPWRAFGRCIELVEVDRLKRPSGNRNVPDSGIEKGERGQPTRYYIESAPDDGGKKQIVPIDRYDDRGRPKVLHLFRRTRPGQQRGIPHFAALVKIFHNLDQFVEAELMAARVAACLTAFITKNDGLEAAMADAEEESETSRIQKMSPAMIGYLEPGEDVKMVDPNRPADSFAPFVTAMLRFIAQRLGISYEQLTKDFSQTNYSSARAALLEGRRTFLSWRAWLRRAFCQPVWELVLEEAALRGKFDAKDFYAKKHEYCRADWIGGGWGWVDPVKEVNASTLAIEGDLSTLAEECAAQGRDWEEVLEQRLREKARQQELAKKFGLETQNDEVQA